MEKKLRKQAEVVCANCGITYSKNVSEVKRNQRLGRKSYCSGSCRSKKAYEEVYYRGDSRCDNIRDKYTGFRCMLVRTKQKAKLENNLTLDYLSQLWEKSHVCPYSGVTLVIPHYSGTHDHMYTASIDRIDSNNGYVEGNIQFVSVAMNHMKNTMTHAETLQLCNIIAQNYNK